MRQAGVVAAGGIVALTENVDRLADDHEKAATLASGLREIDAIEVDPFSGETNMVFISMEPETSIELGRYLGEHGVIITVDVRVRLVTHLDVSRDDISQVINLVRAFFKN